MNSIAPLVKGDTILIISPAKAIPKEPFLLAVKVFEDWGLKVEIGQYALEEYNYFSANDEGRASDLQWALDHPTAKAIITSRGGYGSVRIVDEVDYSHFLINPKWLVGFSDITVFHNKLHQFNLPSVHAVAPLYFDRLNPTDETVVTLQKALFGKSLYTDLTWHEHNKKGEGEGVLVGGNLAIVASLIGTSLDIDTKGKILFLEDVSEYAYRIDRMMWSLKKANKLSELAGLVIGGFTGMKMSMETFGCSIEELLHGHTKEYDYPILFNYPAGHQLDNRALLFGTHYKMCVSEAGCWLKNLPNG